MLPWTMQRAGRFDFDIEVGMFWFLRKKNKEEHRYYLLPGMGKANRRKRAAYLRWAIAVGLLISAILALILYVFNRSSPLFGG